MVSQRFEPQIAHALISAFVNAHAAGTPVTVDSIEVELDKPEYVYETPRLARGNMIDAGDREVTVLLRLEQPALAVLGISRLMNAPVENGEGLQVLRYGPGGHSAPHFDFLVPSNTANEASLARSGQRMSTLIVYLNDVPQGGATAFPAIGLSVTPRRGNAVYFEYAKQPPAARWKVAPRRRAGHRGAEMGVDEMDAQPAFRPGAG